MDFYECFMVKQNLFDHPQGYDLVMAWSSTGLFSEEVLVIELDLSQASIKCPNYYKGDSSDFSMIEDLMLDFIRALLSILFSNPAGGLNYCAETTPPANSGQRTLSTQCLQNKN